jgi:hypothetical protein
MAYIEKIVDAITGEETLKPYTAEQMAEVEAHKVEAAKRANETAQAEAAQQIAKAKLDALGLTTDDLKALGL